ncbi:MAG: hypothetical protein R3E90_04305 [Marinicella sp.]
MDLTEKLFEFSSALMIEQIELTSLPKGYGLVAYIFYWETNCQFSGWYALENLSDCLDVIINSYNDIGLKEEAMGIQKAAEVWDETLQNYDEVTVAYKSVSNPYADENNRWDYINAYLKKNASALFYE